MDPSKCGLERTGIKFTMPGFRSGVVCFHAQHVWGRRTEQDTITRTRGYCPAATTIPRPVPHPDFWPVLWMSYTEVIIHAGCAFVYHGSAQVNSHCYPRCRSIARRTVPSSWIDFIGGHAKYLSRRSFRVSLTFSSDGRGYCVRRNREWSTNR